MQEKNLTNKERYELKREKKQEETLKTQRQRKAKRFLFWGIALIVIALSFWGIGRWATNTTPDYENKTVSEVTDGDWIKGNSDSDVILMEYGDFQCPACASYQPIVKQLAEEFGDRIGIVYRHFPLRSIHAKAQLSGQAAEAAGLQGKFWEMHDLLYERQTTWVEDRNHEDLFVGYAQELELDTDKFKQDMNSSITKNKVDGDYLSSVNAGLNSTPSFFLNGQKISNPRSYSEFAALINEALQTQ